MNGCMIAIQCMNFRIKEGNSLLDKRYHLDMITAIWTAWRDRVEGNHER
jgi:hypothetical protein